MRCAGWIAAAALAATGAVAQEMTDETCRAALQTLEQVIGAPSEQTFGRFVGVTPEGQCLHEASARFGQEDFFETFRWRAAWPGSISAQTPFPHSVAVELRGLTPEDEFMAVFSDISFVAGLRYDAETRELFLEQATAQFDTGDSVTVRAVLSGLNLDNLGAAELSIGGTRASALELVIDSNVLLGLFAVGAASENDLTAEEVRQAARVLVDWIPADSLGAADRAALDRMIGDLPQARGLLEIGLSFDPPIGVIGLGATGVALDEAPRSDAFPPLEQDFSRAFELFFDSAQMRADWRPGG